MATQTRIALKNSGVSSNTPPLVDMSYGELAINYADGKLFYKTSTDLLASYSIVVPGIDKDVIFNDSGVYGTSSGLTYNKATANLAVTNLVTTKSVNFNNQSNLTVGEYSTSNTSQVVVDSFSLSTYRTAKYTVQITSGSTYHSEEITIIHDDSSPRIVEYGVIFSDGTSLGSFDVSVQSGNINLLFTPVNSSNTLKFIRTLITV